MHSQTTLNYMHSAFETWETDWNMIFQSQSVYLHPHFKKRNSIPDIMKHVLNGILKLPWYSEDLLSWYNRITTTSLMNWIPEKNLTTWPQTTWRWHTQHYSTPIKLQFAPNSRMVHLGIYKQHIVWTIFHGIHVQSASKFTVQLYVKRQIIYLFIPITVVLSNTPIVAFRGPWAKPLASEDFFLIGDGYVYTYKKISQVPPRFELGSLDSESRVLTITPWNLIWNGMN